MEKENSKERDSFAMAFLRELSQQNKTQNEQNSLAIKTQSKNNFLTLVIVLSMWFSTTMGFLWYMDQYDYTTEITEEVYTQDGEGENNIIGDIGGDFNGSDFKEEENNQEKNQEE